MIVDAVQWTGQSIEEMPEWIQMLVKAGPYIWSVPPRLFVATVYGNREVHKNDWIVNERVRELKVYSPDIFDAIYEAVEE